MPKHFATSVTHLQLYIYDDDISYQLNLNSDFGKNYMIWWNSAKILILIFWYIQILFIFKFKKKLSSNSNHPIVISDRIDLTLILTFI